MFQTPFADQIRHEAGIPTMAVGNITTRPSEHDPRVAAAPTSCVLARPHLKNPNWTMFAAENQGFVMPWPKQYFGRPHGPLKKKNAATAS